jgi:hypothetical protein
MTVTMRIVKRLSAEARLENAEILRELDRYQYFPLAEGMRAVLHNLNLNHRTSAGSLLRLPSPTMRRTALTR